MKKLLTLLITSFVFIGCGNENSFVPTQTKSPIIKVIECKYYVNGLCNVTISNGENYIYIIDSCNKYSVGDTITFKK